MFVNVVNVFFFVMFEMLIDGEYMRMEYFSFNDEFSFVVVDLVFVSLGKKKSS